MKQSRYLGFLLLMSGLALGLKGAAPPGRVHLPTGQHQLFLDDYLVGSLYRVKRRVNQPVKYEGNPVVFAEKPWEKHPGPDWNPAETEAIQIRSAPCWDPQEQVWKMWYYSGSRTLFARSKDGVTWEKPSLGKRELEGSKDNNLVLVLVKGDPEAFIQHLLLDPDGTPERRYKGFIGARDRHPVVSADGYVFTKLDVPLVPSQDESHLNYDEIKKRFIATVKHRGPFGRSVFLSLSKDFEQWTEPELIFHADASDGELRVEVVNERGREVLEGWTRDRCRSIRGDHIGTEIKWTGQQDLSSLHGKRIRFRFRLHNARLFSFWIQ